MSSRVLGVSGSPIPDSNTDRVVKTVLRATGLETDFVKLSDLDLHPCKACLACARTNVCSGYEDGWRELSAKVVRADAFVVGGWMPFGILDAHTKMFLERTFCLRHSVLLNAGKVGVAVITGTVDPRPAADDVLEYFSSEGVTPLGSVLASGIDPCWSCGLGEVCVQGGTLPMVLSGYQVYNYPYADRLPSLDDFKIVPELVPPPVEEQPRVLAEAARLGALIAEELERRAERRRVVLEEAVPGAVSMSGVARLGALTERSGTLGWVSDDALRKKLTRLAASAARHDEEGRSSRAVADLLAFGRAALLRGIEETDSTGIELLVAEARRAIIDCYE